ncbi:hypothetical protein [Salinicoccus sp. HZC-1]|uniref:hypothetical protein n=1 Tax=Salinicoccus sp. HZC-1 TaxID=3385497 RepID=UPI00398AD58D
MSRIKYISQFAHAYLTDMFLLLFIILFLNVHNGKEALIFPFTVIVIAMMIISFFIVKYLRLGRIYFMLPVVLIIALMLGFNWLGAVLVAYLPLLRLEYLHDDADNVFSHITLIVTFLLLIGTNLLTTEATINYSMHFHLIFLSLLVFFFVGRIIVYLIDNGYSKSKNLIMFFAASGAFLLIGIFIGWIYHYIAFAAKYIIVMLLNGLIFLLRPLFNTLENIKFEPPQLEMDEENEAQEGEELQQSFDQKSALSQIPLDTIMAILFIIAVIAGLYIYYRRRERLSAVRKAETAKSSASILRTKRESAHEKLEAPDDRVRKVYFGFEKWLAARNLGRYHNETITEWIRRLNLEEIIDQKRLGIYMETRYRDTDFTNEDYQKYKENIQLMKKDISEHFKNH